MSHSVECAKSSILDLANKGVREAKLADTLTQPGEAEQGYRQAIGYLTAANALLRAFPVLHNELIEHSDLMYLRKIERRYRV